MEKLLSWTKFEALEDMPCDFQQCGILTSVDPDEHVLPPFKLKNSKYLTKACTGFVLKYVFIIIDHISSHCFPQYVYCVDICL